MAEIMPPQVDAEQSSLAVPSLLQNIMVGWGLLGGVIFVVIVVMSIVSIVGRKLFGAPITGDVELLMMGAAVGSAAFLPLCEWEDHHIKVDALTGWMSTKKRAGLDAIAHLLLCAMASLIAWRSTLYAIEARENAEMSTLLLVPQWLPISFLVPSFALLAVAAYCRAGNAIRIAWSDR
ncbi:TRAP transporter small permease [Rhizobacter sp. AJA081-3]|uniref:TRAP transporter small permease n=1 Tax=Rhizobacter sp. AJA081-3 TaxID=2753607 RepID=UPI001ADFDE68|nr:TRAP transporter small permease [Rhizobacter sp. AJA081-3]QTN25727.1 TRAP transporter small permease [Rhizobacter sp. AJA081-3]